MRRLRALPLTVATLSAGLVLTACGGGSGSDSASAKDSSSASPTASAGSGTDTTPTTSAADGSSAGTSATTAPSGSTSGGGSADSKASSNGSGGSGGGQGCRTADLALSVAAGSGAQSVGSAGPVIIKMTNHGSRTCTMKGYPGVDLVGGGTRWSLSRQTSVSPRAVTVAPGASTSFTVTYMPYSAGSGQQIDVKTIVITPPNETHSTDLPWEFQPVLLQDGATHPATYVGPVGAN
ncbi:DUF4232 domain-containing protein [Actinacidiphila acidipaludis]|uniref:DUF4232 domain-containing protein n=1 Tax=Actinacidiphila acidipaludis TaxID=2873382 RepID=A0ABS7QBU3_9ACTN|nr:DUF4232 domain-containing protein [Streptomyces acidipaludis]MBY8880306.1 DUF4232 domain-containing protein [Streptomyces acidipaludis]